MAQYPKIEKKASPAATLRAMKRGDKIIIPTREIKTHCLRAAASRLKGYGYSFSVTEAGLINEMSVVCLKSPKQ